MRTGTGAGSREGELLYRLTAQERECLRLVAGHRSSKEIAAELGISKTSVDTYCDRAREKLGVRGRYEAARMLAAALAGPAPAARDVAARPTAATPETAVAARRSGLRPSRGALALLAVIMAPIAIATLLAGLRALREVVPDPHQAAPAIQTAARPPPAG